MSPKRKTRQVDPLGTLLHDTAVLRADVAWLIQIVTERIPRPEAGDLPERRASASQADQRVEAALDNAGKPPSGPMPPPGSTPFN